MLNRGQCCYRTGSLSGASSSFERGSDYIFSSLELPRARGALLSVLDSMH